ncbi:RNA-directed DNA polymerase, eukaryota [Tanacetum coccineum]
MDYLQCLANMSDTRSIQILSQSTIPKSLQVLMSLGFGKKRKHCFTVLSIRRTRLTPTSLEMCMCLKDHLDAKERKQDKCPLETPLDFEEGVFDDEVQQNEAIPLSDEEIALDASSEGTMSPGGPRLVQDQADDLERSVTRDEIRMAVWNCSENKSPGPDGYSFKFFKKYWSFVGPDLCEAVEQFFMNGAFSKGCNSFSSVYFKAYDSVRWDFLIDVLEAFGFGSKWCHWIRGTFCFAKASVLVNGSPSNEFLFHGGLKQGDPLAPYLFILVMESLHLSFSRVVDAGMFKGIRLNVGVTIQLFIEQSGVGVPRVDVETAASSIGCSIMNDQFRYLGVMVGENMSRHKAWADVVLKLRSRLSKWKSKTLSIGGRLTLLKSGFLGCFPLLYYMSIFKAPRGILKEMESIRNNFFIWADSLDKKITWVAWNNVLAWKKNGGLGVLSFYALNRAMLFKWVWRFISEDGSLWSRVIQAVYGSRIGSHSVHMASTWSSIMREVQLLKSKGFGFYVLCLNAVGEE